MATESWQNSSQTSAGSSNSSRFSFLDRRDRKRIVVYKRHIGLSLDSQENLCQSLDK
ncbi:MAG: hypothetical protein M1820_010695, partial [Bogoriella megaspora]